MLACKFCAIFAVALLLTIFASPVAAFKLFISQRKKKILLLLYRTAIESSRVQQRMTIDISSLTRIEEARAKDSNVHWLDDETPRIYVHHSDVLLRTNNNKITNNQLQFVCSNGHVGGQCSRSLTWSTIAAHRFIISRAPKFRFTETTIGQSSDALTVRRWMTEMDEWAEYAGIAWMCTIDANQGCHTHTHARTHNFIINKLLCHLSFLSFIGCHVVTHWYLIHFIVTDVRWAA